jgi:DNA polymerase III delta prime subunit
LQSKKRLQKSVKVLIDNLRAKHQLCIFHLFKMIGADVYDALRSKRTTYRDKIKLCLYFTEIKNIFRTYDEQVATERLEKLMDEYGDISSILRRYIRKKMHPTQTSNGSHCS